MVKIIRYAIAVLIAAFILVQIISYFGFSGGRQIGGIFGQVGPGSTSENFCSDSDNGFNVNQKGSCTSNSGNGQDSCTEDIINEYVCKDLKCTQVKFRCPFGCSNGACLGS